MPASVALLPPSTPRPAHCRAIARMRASNSSRRRMSACHSGSATPNSRGASIATSIRPCCPALLRLPSAVAARFFAGPSSHLIFQRDRIARAHSKATQMAIHAPSRTRVRFAVAALSAVCAFHAVVHAASPVPDRVSLSESTITWSTVKYATNAENGSRQRVARQEDHRRSHVQDPRARESLSEGNARARIWRAHSFHHLQADRPRTALSHGSRRALRDQGRHFLLRLADGVWRHLPHVPGCRARQDVAEAVGFQGGEGECRRSDGVDVA